MDHVIAHYSPCSEVPMSNKNKKQNSKPQRSSVNHTAAVVKMLLSFKQDARLAFSLSAYKHFISNHFQMVNVNIMILPTSHLYTLYFGVYLCRVSCWTRWTASTHYTESRWSWPPTDRTLWTQPCCGLEDWIVKSVRFPLFPLILCVSALCERTQQI